MPDLNRSIDYFLNSSTGEFKDNTAGDISAQDLRDFVKSSWNPQVDNGFRLTTQSGTPVSTSDRTSQSTIYLTPVNHNVIGLALSSTDLISLAIEEIAIPLSGLTSGKNYDVFAFTSTATPSSTNTTTDVITFASATGWATGSQVMVETSGGGLTAGLTYWWNAASSTTGTLHGSLSGALAGSAPSRENLTASITSQLRGISLELLAYSTDTARATALARVSGMQTKSGDPTRRFIGTVRTTSTTTIEESLDKLFLWNAYNQVLRPVRGVLETADSWSYTTATIRQANANSANRFQYVTGDAATLVLARVESYAAVTNSTRPARVGVGVDSTTVFSGRPGRLFATAGGVQGELTGSYVGYPGLGYHAINWLEAGGDNSCTFIGDDTAGVGQQAMIWGLVPA